LIDRSIIMHADDRDGVDPYVGGDLLIDGSIIMGPADDQVWRRCICRERTIRPDRDSMQDQARDGTMDPMVVMMMMMVVVVVMVMIMMTTVGGGW
jgi:hypothetical protein